MRKLREIKLLPLDTFQFLSSIKQTIVITSIVAFCYGVFGMGSVLLIDIVSFMAAFLVLLFLIKIEEEKDTVQKTSLFSGTTQVWQFLWKTEDFL